MYIYMCVCVYIYIYFFFFFFFKFLAVQGFNSGTCTCYSGTRPLELLYQLFLHWLFLRWGSLALYPDQLGPICASPCSWDDKHVPLHPATGLDGGLTNFLPGLTLNHSLLDLCLTSIRITGLSHHIWPFWSFFISHTYMIKAGEELSSGLVMVIHND
jgi:hypothetical protein